MPDTAPVPRANVEHRRAIAFAALLLVAMVGIAVRAGWTQAFDAALIDAIRGVGGAGLLPVVSGLTDSGSFYVLTAISVLATILLFVTGARVQAVRFCLVVAGGRIAVEIVKQLVARARPPIAEQAVAVHSFSFPSSHAANATITYVALAFFLTHFPPHRHWRPALLALAAVLALAIGMSRVWLGVHWPIDVLAGWLFGIGWLALASAVPVPARFRNGT